MPSQERARIEKAKADIVILENALEMYKLEQSKPNDLFSCFT